MSEELSTKVFRSGYESDTLFANLARELAINHLTLEEILKNHKIPLEDWEYIAQNERFQAILESEIASWSSALNTNERTRLKAAALVENWLPEANMRLTDPNENLPAKVELAKLLTRIADMGIARSNIEGGGERINVTINLGSDTQLSFNKALSKPKTIDSTAEEVNV